LGAKYIKYHKINKNLENFREASLLLGARLVASLTFMFVGKLGNAPPLSIVRQKWQRVQRS